MVAPAVSVVIPTYNRAAFLPGAIDSVRRQTFGDWELVVVDDASTDATAEKFAAFAQGDPRIRLVRNRGTKGPAGARNAGLAECRAPWAAFLDSDDSWEPEKLARFMAAAAANPEAVLIGSNYWIVDRVAGGRQTILEFIARTMMPWWESEAAIAAIVPCASIKSTPSVLAQRDVMLSTAIAECLWVHTSSAMVRLAAAKEAGGFNENLSQTEDIELWLSLGELGRVVFIPEVLATYDATGRDEALGERYASHEPARKPSLYKSRLLHLQLLRRIAERHRLTPAQERVLIGRLAHRHRACAAAARHIMPFSVVLGHSLAGSRFTPLRRLARWVQPLEQVT